MKSRKVFVVLAVVALVMSAAVTLWASEKININTASADELTQLKKIGPSIAAAIVEYRTAEGSFDKPEDLMNVKGVGPKIYEMNKDMIVTKSASAAAKPAKTEAPKKTTAKKQ